MWIEILIIIGGKPVYSVTPLAGVWIEILQWEQRNIVMKVTPLAGVWIEMCIITGGYGQPQSLPLRECGLKWLSNSDDIHNELSLPLRECGLK